MITVQKLIKGVLKGKYTKLDANVLIFKNFKNENFDLFCLDFKNSVSIFFNEIMFEFSDDDFLQIFDDIKRFNRNDDKTMIIEKIEIPKIYIENEYCWGKVKHFYRKIGDNECIFNVKGFDSKPIRSEYYKEVISLNDLIINYISNSWYGIGYGFKNHNLEKLHHFPILLDIVKTLPPQPNTKEKPELSKIWLSEPKVTVSDFLIMGIEKGIWNEQYNIITARGSLYGTGKSLLGSLFIALKGYAISNSIDYKEAGKAFCSFFNIPISENVKEPYRAFSSGTEKQIRELKRAFNIK